MNVFEEQIVAYMSAKYGPVEAFSLQDRRTFYPDVHVNIHRIAPTEQFPHFTFFTTGMSNRPLSIPDGAQEDDEDFRFAELIMRLPPDWDLPQSDLQSPSYWPLHWMRKIAYYPHQNGLWLGRRYEVFDNVRSLAPGVPQTGWFVMANPADTGPITLTAGQIMNFYFVTAIFPDELQMVDRFKLCIQLIVRNGLTTDPRRQTTRRAGESEKVAQGDGFIAEVINSMFVDDRPVAPWSDVPPITECEWK